MKLLWSSRSPYVRKVMVAAHELGIADRIALERVMVTSRDVNPVVTAVNPLNQIPALVLDDGTSLFDSPVIVEYLDTMFGDRRLIPRDPSRRWTVLRLQALGDGLMGLTVARLGERNREQPSADHLRAAWLKSGATLDTLERECVHLAALSAGSIAVAVALAYLDFRFDDDAWRGGRPRLAAWFEAFRGRPSMEATEPENVY